MRRYAVSEIIGSLLMVVMVVAIASIVLVAVNQWVYTQRMSTLQMMREAVTINIYNYGGVPLTIARIYVNGTLILDGGYTVKPGDHLSIDLSYEWIDGGRYIIAVYTEGGRVARIEEKAPRI
jgi:TRAP-type mannitol/chloroaromatic compound transport system permease small subunit